MTLFSIMHPASRWHISRRFSGQIFRESGKKSIVISYLLEDGVTALTTRLVRVLAGSNLGDMAEYVVYAETRLCRHKLRLGEKTLSLGLFSSPEGEFLGKYDLEATFRSETPMSFRNSPSPGLGNG